MRLLGTRHLPLAMLVLALSVGCTQRDGVLGRLGGWQSPDGGQVAGTCSDSPVVTLQKQPTCTGRLAASRFSSALCVCNDLRLANSLKTDGFDSSQGPYKANSSNRGGAAVGVNRNYVQVGGATDVAGSFTIAGASPLQFVGSLLVRGDLWVGADVSVAGTATVFRDAWITGNLTVLGALLVSRQLTHMGTVSAPLKVAPIDHQETVAVSPPCACGASDLLDTAGLVSNARAENDNASTGVKPDVLAAISGGREWTLPCGRIYLSQIAGTGDVIIHVNGPSALFVDGAIALNGSLTFQLAPAAEIDVFVRQDVAVQGPLTMAYQDRPAAGRIAVAGAAPIALVSPFVGNLYAPKALVTTTGDIEIWGAVFANGFQGTASATVIFDREIVTVGENCTAPLPPAGICRQCEWCYGGMACVGGVCSPCHTDSDCCGQGVCSNGSCGPLVQ